MRAIAALGLALSMTAGSAVAQPDRAGSHATCERCPGTYISAGELGRYQQKALAEKLVDQQVRAIDIGKAHVAVGDNPSRQALGARPFPLLSTIR